MNNLDISDEQMTFTTQINSSAIQPGVYIFTANVKAKEIKEQPWWREWNSTEGNLDGSKTHNLLPFLEDLKQDLRPLAKPIGHFCYVIQKKS